MSYSTMPTYYFGLYREPSTNQVLKNILQPSIPQIHKIPSLSDCEEYVGGYYLCLDVSGVNPQDIALDIREGHLVVELEKEFDPYKVAHSNWDKAYGIFSRAFKLPENVDIKKVTYQVKENRLEIRMDKIATTQTEREIQERGRPSRLQNSEI